MFSNENSFGYSGAKVIKKNRRGHKILRPRLRENYQDEPVVS